MTCKGVCREAERMDSGCEPWEYVWIGERCYMWVTDAYGVEWDQEKLMRGCDKEKGVGVTPERLWLGVTHGGVQR